MESMFLLGETTRAASLRCIMQSFASSYICLCCLLFLDGYYDEEKIQQPSSSSDNLATRLFHAYCGSVSYLDNKCLPGLAFKNNLPYLEVKVDFLHTRMLTSETQMQFYQIAVFMGCAAGEIELGFSTDQPPANLKVEIQSWFSANFSSQTSSSSMENTKYSPSFSTNTITQIDHVIAERRRREKQNHSFQILRALLPQLPKKDKASVLSSTVEYLSSMRSQTGELETRNAALEMQISTALREELGFRAPSTLERVSVEIFAANSSSSTISQLAIFLDLRISLRSEKCSLLDLVARILGFLKQQQRIINVCLLSLQSNTTIVESTPLLGLLLRLKVEGDEFDETGFQEAVRRVVDDLPH